MDWFALAAGGAAALLLIHLTVALLKPEWFS